VVVTVEALDDDEGDNGLVEFQFAVSTQDTLPYATHSPSF